MSLLSSRRLWYWSGALLWVALRAGPLMVSLEPAACSALTSVQPYGLHRCRGLGHAFLRHVERTKALALVVDLSAGALDDMPPAHGSGRHPTGADLPPWEAVDLLRQELALYKVELPQAPTIVVANKVDRLDDAEAQLHRLRCA